jgi:hypothetical protein
VSLVSVCLCVVSPSLTRTATRVCVSCKKKKAKIWGLQVLSVSGFWVSRVFVLHAIYRGLGGEIPHYFIVLQLFTLNINMNKKPNILSTILLTMCLLSGVVQFAGGLDI